MSLNWFISVDDHLIEPARLWQERVPERMRDERAAHRPRRRLGVLGLRGPPDRHHRPQRRRRQEAARSSRPSRSPTTTCARAATSPRPASPTWTRATCCRRCCSRRSPATAARSSTRPRTRTSRSSACGRGTTSSSRSSPAPIPGRFIPMMIIPLWDPVAAAAEIERTAALGAKSIAFSENPTKLGLPSIHTDYWDPVFQACERHRLRAVDARRVVVEPDPHVRRHADARVHGLLGGGEPGRHAARLAVQRQLRAVPEPQDRAVGGLDRLDPVLPRAGRAGHRQAALLGVALRHRHERRATSAARPRARRRFALDTDIRRCSRTTCSARSSRTRPASGCSTSSARTT